MTTMPCPSTAIPLHRPWWSRLAADLGRALRPAPRAAPEPDLGSLAHLGDTTLRDIGAPDWVRERARGAADPWAQTRHDRRNWWVV